MNTKHLVLLLTFVTVVTLSIPALTEVLAEASKAGKSVFPEIEESYSESYVGSESVLLDVEIVEAKGQSYKIGRQKCELTQPGKASPGFYRTEVGGLLELRLGSETRILVYPETEIEIAPMGASWPSVINFRVLKGEVDFKTTRASGKFLRVITEGICVNPDMVNFKVVYNPGICAGEIIVKHGILRATADADPNRFCSISTSFGISFTDGILKIPRKAQIKNYQWKLSL